MSFRVTQSMMHSQILRNINRNLNKMSDQQNELSTGRKINKPSDDPVGVTYALRYRSELSMNDQYQRNVDAAKSYVDHTDTVLNQVNELFQRTNELTTQGVNGTLSTTDMKTIAEELGQIYEQAVSLGNDQLNGKYIFNGQFTDKQPYTSAAASTQSTDDQQIVYQFAAGVKVPINVNGNDVFGAPSDSDNLFAVIKGLQQSFDNGDQTAAQGLMSKLQSRFDTFLGVRADVGARSNRIDLIDSRIKDLDINLTELDSKIEDADIAETITKLQTEQSVYQASLSVGAKVIQPSLLDYLR